MKNSLNVEVKLKMTARALLGTAIMCMQVALTAPAFSQVAEKRFFTIAAVEPKGGANVENEPLPDQPLPPGGGYVFKQPDQTGRWEMSAYVWMPSQIVVNQGDHVTLEFVGINGASHPTEIEGLEHTFTLRRGHVERIEFIAARPGTYPIVCHSHVPSMRGELVVLPRR